MPSDTDAPLTGAALLAKLRQDLAAIEAMALDDSDRTKAIAKLARAAIGCIEAAA